MYYPGGMTNLIYSSLPAGNIIGLFGLIPLMRRVSMRTQVSDQYPNHERIITNPIGYYRYSNLYTGHCADSHIIRLLASVNASSQVTNHTFSDMRMRFQIDSGHSDGSDDYAYRPYRSELDATRGNRLIHCTSLESFTGMNRSD